MSNYSIKDLETLSGIKAHTLRIWEQRYNIIKPKRTDTNIRFYDDEDLKRILNISLLNQNGFKISKIADMSTLEINEKVFDLAQESLKYPDQVQALMMSMMEIDEDRFEKTISRSILQFGLEKTMIHIVYPFLNKVGLLWQIGTISPYQEHFVSNLIRQKIIVSIDSQTNLISESKKFLLYLPESELHEIGLLFATYILKTRGHKVFYFGQTLPVEDLIQACKTCQPDCTFTIITSLAHQEILHLGENLGQNLPSTVHVISSNLIQKSDFQYQNMFVAESAQAFIDFLETEVSKKLW